MLSDGAISIPEPVAVVVLKAIIVYSQPELLTLALLNDTSKNRQGTTPPLSEIMSNPFLQYRLVVDSNKSFRHGLSADEVLRRSDGEFFATLQSLCEMEDMLLSPS